MILDAGLPKGVRKAIRDSYKELCKTNGGRGDLSVAVRSSATAEGKLIVNKEYNMAICRIESQRLTHEIVRSSDRQLCWSASNVS
jgi:HKD family nuclease